MNTLDLDYLSPFAGNSFHLYIGATEYSDEAETGEVSGFKLVVNDLFIDQVRMAATLLETTPGGVCLNFPSLSVIDAPASKATVRVAKDAHGQTVLEFQAILEERFERPPHLVSDSLITPEMIEDAFEWSKEQDAPHSGVILGEGNYLYLMPDHGAQKVVESGLIWWPEHVAPDMRWMDLDIFSPRSDVRDPDVFASIHDLMKQCCAAFVEQQSWKPDLFDVNRMLAKLRNVLEQEKDEVRARPIIQQLRERDIMLPFDIAY